jgi:hypothetical protein
MADIAGVLPARSKFAVSLPLLVYLVAFAAVLGGGDGVLRDPDSYWHIAVGRWIIAHGAVPHHDIFSHSMPDAAYVPHEWLSDVIFALVYDRFGWAGIVVATALAFAATWALLARFLARMLPPAAALIAVAASWLVCLSHLLARPHMFGFPLFVIWMGTLVAARAERRAPPLLLAALMLPWANLHAGYFLGLVLAALLAGEALLEAENRPARWAVVRGWGLFGLAATAFSLMTPNGLAGLLMPFQIEDMSFTLSMLNEWKSPDFQSLTPLELWLLGGLFGILATGVRLPPVRIAIVLLLLHMTLVHRRHADFLGLLVPLIVAPALAPRLMAAAANGAKGALDRAMTELAKPATPLGFAAVGAVLVLLAAGTLTRGLVRDDDMITPGAALAAVAAQHVTGPVLNAYPFGGFLIFHGIAPFIDGRAEMYGDAFVKRFSEATNARSGELAQLLDQYRIAWTLLEPQSPGNVLLDHMPGWRRLYADKVAVVHVRAAAWHGVDGPDEPGHDDRRGFGE